MTTSSSIESANKALLNGHGEVDASRELDLSSRSLREVCADIHDRIHTFLSVSAKDDDDRLRRTQEHTRVSLNVIEEALRRYQLPKLSLSYNGGKDCLVLLLLYLAGLHRHYDTHSHHAPFPTAVPSIYAKPPDPFPSVTTFVASSTAEYHLDLAHVSTNPGPDRKSRSHTSPPSTANGAVHPDTPGGAPSQLVVTFRDAFAQYLADHPQVEAILVGTRRSDPHGAKLTHFDMTDGNWPRFMRVHPVIDWGLSEIWTFLRHPAMSDPRTGRKLEYCAMYDQGYTSLGGVNDTFRNPRLRAVVVDDRGQKAERYRPAFEMIDDEEERLGRE